MKSNMNLKSHYKKTKKNLKFYQKKKIMRKKKRKNYFKCCNL